MVAYEFYWRDPIKGYQLIGVLPERRKKRARITQESILNWVKEISGEDMDLNDIFFITRMVDKNSGKFLRFKE